jgi:predicted double-glycine peptidase
MPGPARPASPKSGLAVLTGALAVLASTPATAAMPMPTTAGGAYAVQVVSWRDLPFRSVVRQQYDYSCGSAALATLLKFHYGRLLDEAEIFKAMFAVGDQKTIQRVGFSLLEMKQYLSKLGFEADGYKLTLADIEEIGAPGIVLVTTGTYRHFVVVKGASGGRVLVGDPATGERVYSYAEFHKIWTNGIFFAIRDARGGFNSPAEWMRHAGPVKNPYLAELNAASMLRDLPPLYQLTPVFVLR